MINRETYLKQLIIRQNNGLVKIITGLRRSGKSFLLNEIFYNYLLSSGVAAKQIIKFSFEDQDDLDLIGEDIANLQNNNSVVPHKKFMNFINSQIKEDIQYYLLLDEIQWLEGYASVLNSYHTKHNIDIYVTGSNSNCLSHDIVTQFRGKSDQIHIYPLSFAEFYSAFKSTKEDAWKEYSTFGGLPGLFKLQTDEQKINYLKNLVTLTYLKDIKEKHNVRDDNSLAMLLNVVSSCISCLISPRKLENTFKSIAKESLSFMTIEKFINYFEQSFLVKKAYRFDIKGKKYIDSLYKLYFEDIGIRNAQIEFRQNEENHIMENVIFNELRIRGFDIDVGFTGQNNPYEINFIATKGNKKYYIQSALSIQDSKKFEQETRCFKSIIDSYKKILIISDNIKTFNTEDGYLVINLFDFLLNDKSLEF